MAYMGIWEHPTRKNRDYGGNFQEIAECWGRGASFREYPKPTHVWIVRGYWWTVCYDGVTPEPEEEIEDLIIVQKRLNPNIGRRG